MTTERKIVRLALPLLLGLSLCAVASAQSTNLTAQTPPWEKIKIADYVQSVKFGGDFRLRYDHSFKRGAAANDRSRLRYRLRFGADIELPENFLVNTRLASGTGEQVGTNQSFDNLGGQKDIWVDTAYLRWTPELSENGKVHLTGGRMINPLWRIYSSDLIWDDDFNPEGFAQGAEWLLPGGISAFANALQMVADEDSNSSKNQWLFSQQLGAEARLPLRSRLRAAAAYHKWSDENRGTLSPVTAQDGNRRTAGGALLNRFGVAEFTAQLSSWIEKTPLAFSGTVARNFRARNNGTTITGPAARDGYQVGAILGKAAMAKTWEMAYFKKYAQTDVTVADVADSDFGDGGTNRSGHIVWLAYAPRNWMLIKAKYFITDVIDRQFVPGDKAVNRLQFDTSVKF